MLEPDPESKSEPQTWTRPDSKSLLSPPEQELGGVPGDVLVDELLQQVQQQLRQVRHGVVQRRGQETRHVAPVPRGEVAVVLHGVHHHPHELFLSQERVELVQSRVEHLRLHIPWTLCGNYNEVLVLLVSAIFQVSKDFGLAILTGDKGCNLGDSDLPRSLSNLSTNSPSF